MSVPVDQIGALLSSGQAIMTPQGAATAAMEGVPFAMPATPTAVTQFDTALQAQGGGAVYPTPGTSTAASEAASNNVFNQYLTNIGGGAAEQAAGITTPAASSAPATSNATPAFSWLDPFPWLASEGLNLLLIVLGVVTVIIVLTALFRQAGNSTPARYVGENARAAASAARGAKSAVAGTADELPLLAAA